jgi:Tol biopolymer transport system component
MWVDHQGETHEILPLAPNYYGPYRISPDGKKLAYIVFEDLNNSIRNAKLYVIDLERNISNLIDDGVYMFGIWHPDSKKIAYLKKNTEGSLDLYKRTFNTGKSERIWSLPFTDGSINQITPDNKYIFSNFFSGSSQHGYLLNLDKKDTIRLTNDPGSNQFAPFLTHNGKYLIYASTETGQYDLFCMPFPPTGEKWRITKNGAESYAFSSIDDKIYLRSIDVRKMMVVNLDLTNGFDFDEPQLLWEKDFLDIPGPSFELSTDGKYFLMKKSVVKGHTTSKINVITNFNEEIKQKAAEE